MRLHIAFWKQSHCGGDGDGLGMILGERDIVPQLLINSPFTKDSQAFFSSSMYVYSVCTEPTFNVKWTSCHGNGYIPIQQTSNLSSLWFLEIYRDTFMLNGNALPKLNMTPNPYHFTLSHHQLEKSYDNQATTSPHDLLGKKSLSHWPASYDN